MGRRAAIGRAFRVTDKDVRSYKWTARPRSMTPNPMGVTTLAQVNGRGAYSARAASHGLTPAERLSRARKLVGGSGSGMRANKHRAKFMRPLKANKSSPKAVKANRKTAGKRLAAYSAARRRGMSPNSARRSALRNAPFTANERTRGAGFMGSKARRKGSKKYRRNYVMFDASGQGWDSVSGEKIGSPPTKTRKAGKKKPAKKAKKRKAAKKKTKKAARWDAKRKYKTVTVRRKRKVTATRMVGAKRRTLVSYGGKYKRAKMVNPRTGRVEYSYMYKTKHGYRRIPTKVVSEGMSLKQGEKMRKARNKAAERIIHEGGAFIANKRKGRKVAKKRKRKLKNTKAARKARARYRAAKRAGGARKRKGGKRRSGAKKRRSSGKRKASRKSKRGAGKRKATGGRRGYRTRYNKLRAAGYTHKQAQKGAKASNVGRKVSRKRKGGKRRSGRKAARRRSAKRTKRSGKRKGGKRSMKRNSSRRRHRANRFHRRNGFMAQLKQVLKLGLAVYGGYAVHRVLTALAVEHVYDKYIVGSNAMLKQWEKPIVGAVTGLAVIAGVDKLPILKSMKSETKIAVGAGVIASWLQSVVVTSLAALSQPKAASYLEGYSNSTAYMLRNRHHGMRGLGTPMSIMPRYTPIGSFTQAAAGLGQGFLQAAAGTGEFFNYTPPMAGVGEFFNANRHSAVGEYFAPRGTQGVGHYEAAGPLAMQAAAGVGADPIDDGIRPDSNLDHVLDLAESAAGLGGRRRGMGEFFGATPGAGGGFDEMTVGQQSQWIPNGPLWAGTMNVKGSAETSEMPAGVLAGPGGNGTLSG